MNCWYPRVFEKIVPHFIGDVNQSDHYKTRQIMHFTEKGDSVNKPDVFIVQKKFDLIVWEDIRFKACE